MKRYLLVIFYSLIFTSFCYGQSVTELREIVTFIASDKCEGRETGSPGIYKAQQYVSGKLRASGLDPRYQIFTKENLKCRNIITAIQGLDNDYIVIGAHLDHIGSQNTRRFRQSVFNGADDNASGSAVALSMALHLAKKYNARFVPPEHSIVFIWFTGEEHGLWGSKYFVNNPLAPKDEKIYANHNSLPIFMLNLDMVGRLQNLNRIYLGENNLPVNGILEELYRKYPFGQQIVVWDSQGSDHWSFYQRGVPYVFLHTGLHSDYHQVTDTAEKLNYDGMLKITYLALDLLEAVLRADEGTYNFIPEDIND